MTGSKQGSARLIWRFGRLLDLPSAFRSIGCEAIPAAWPQKGFHSLWQNVRGKIDSMRIKAKGKGEDAAGEAG